MDALVLNVPGAKRKGMQDPKASDEEADGELSEVCEDPDVFKAQTLSKLVA